jgi:hypothetical protein
VSKKAGKQVELRDGDTRWTVELTIDDFRALRHMAGGKMQVKHCEKEFRHLRALGLVKHRFDQGGDWPVALVELTDTGNQALTQEPV